MTVTPATIDQRADIVAMLDDYLAELSTQREIAVGATDAASYPFFDVYWTQPDRRALAIRVKGTDDLGATRPLTSATLLDHYLRKQYDDRSWSLSPAGSEGSAEGRGVR